MSLAALHLRRTESSSSEEAGIVLHDLQLDFCRREARKMTCFSLWHTKLLNGYIRAPEIPALEKSKGHAAQTIVSFTPRAWWAKSVPEDGYIHKNISRHLACSDQGIELVALLLDARWTTLRETVGGILALQTDFESLGKCSEEWDNSTELEASNEGRSLKQIFKAVLLSWGRMSEGMRVFYFHVSGRLLSLRKKNILVEAYLKKSRG